MSDHRDSRQKVNSQNALKCLKFALQPAAILALAGIGEKTLEDPFDRQEKEALYALPLLFPIESGSISEGSYEHIAIRNYIKDLRSQVEKESEAAGLGLLEEERRVDNPARSKRQASREPDEENSDGTGIAGPRKRVKATRVGSQLRSRSEKTGPQSSRKAIWTEPKPSCTKKKRIRLRLVHMVVLRRRSGPSCPHSMKTQ
ncbi:uncharacterized protein KY384_002855 [Bacidia gigantensis]|uniref:uncharacterized protein n=1 Tax=Bacidia gigantensis TaxID=2732470 RepID=UPI001D04BA18|nr:uncharacterized protein KY384_002855 [Bacidia gigantensis]KAG8532370.1 hypothetical protein KY384_002855 [Bacidia gigantensis]